MSNKVIRYIRFIYGIMLSVMLVIIGILLMASCINIYKLGDRPFTVENIYNAFKKIAIPVYITIGAVLIGCIVDFALPSEKQKVKSDKDKKTVLARLERKLGNLSCEPSFALSIKKIKKLRLILRIAAAVLCVGISIPCVIYAFNRNNFTADYDASVIKACKLILPCVFAALGLLIAWVYTENALIKRQIESVKAAIASAEGSKKEATASVTEKKSTKYIIWGIRLAVVAIGIVFIILGMNNGGMADVFSKAINICTECIGIG